MSSGVNKVILLGNLGRDPEVRYTQAGSAVCNLRLAIHTKRKKDDEWIEHTEWVGVVCFGRTAENVAQYLSKGRQIYVEGRMQTRSYKDKDGVEKWSTEVVADEVIFIGGNDAGKRGDDDKRTAKASTRAETPAAFVDVLDDDVPF